MARARKSILRPELPSEVKVAANSGKGCEERAPSKLAEPVIHQ